MNDKNGRVFCGIISDEKRVRMRSFRRYLRGRDVLQRTKDIGLGL
jgi:hypothetical protein